MNYNVESAHRWRNNTSQLLDDFIQIQMRISAFEYASFININRNYVESKIMMTTLSLFKYQTKCKSMDLWDRYKSWLVSFPTTVGIHIERRTIF